MVDDLSRPLLGSIPKRRNGLRPLGIGFAVAALLAGGIGIWFLVFSDDGDSSTSAQLSEPGLAASGGEVVIRAPGGERDGPDGVTITTPDGATLDGNGPVVRSANGPAPMSLSTAPVPALLESGPYGPLPRVAADGLRPFDAYARPEGVIAGTPGRIAIVIGGVGINQANSELAIARLPGEISFAMAPYGSSLADWATRSREAGHELLLQIPLEPYDFPASDPGPHTLLVDAPLTENVDRLAWLMSQFTNFAGIASYAGGRFLADQGAMEMLVAELSHRGLMLLDDGATTQSRAGAYAVGELPFAAADMVIDRDLNAQSIAARLTQLENLARERGYAVGTASAFQLTIEQISQWAEGMADRGVVLVPVTALANDPRDDAMRIEVE